MNSFFKKPFFLTSFGLVLKFCDGIYQHLTQSLTLQKNPEESGFLNYYTFFKKCLKNETEYTAHIFDLEIVGEGFYELTLDDSQRVYSRYGRFELDSKGQLCCLKTKCPLVVDFKFPKNPSHVQVNSHGEVSIWCDQKQQRVTLGFIKLVIFDNPSQLQCVDSHIFYPQKNSDQGRLKKANSYQVGFIRQGFKTPLLVDTYLESL